MPMTIVELEFEGGPLDGRRIAAVTSKEDMAVILDRRGDHASRGANQPAALSAFTASRISTTVRAHSNTCTSSAGLINRCEASMTAYVKQPVRVRRSRLRLVAGALLAVPRTGSAQAPGLASSSAFHRPRRPRATT